MCPLCLERDTLYNEILKMENKRRRRRRVRGPGPVKPSFSQRQVPASYARGKKQSNPKIAQQRYGFSTVSNTEHFMKITATNEFTCTAMHINPGNSEMFPWLSSVAGGWELYRFLKLKFHYKTNTATTTNGTILGSIEYAPGSPLPTDYKTMMAYQGAVSSPLYRDFVMPVDIKSAFSQMQWKNVRQDLNEVDTRKAYDTADLLIATEGNPSGILGGYISVEYVCEFRVPQKSKPLEPVDGLVLQGVPVDHTVIDDSKASNTYIIPFRGSTANPFNGHDINSLNAKITEVGGHLVMPPGTYRHSGVINLSQDIVASGADGIDISTQLITLSDDLKTATHVPGTPTMRWSGAASGVLEYLSIPYDYVQFYAAEAIMGLAVTAVAASLPASGGVTLLGGSSRATTERLINSALRFTGPLAAAAA